MKTKVFYLTTRIMVAIVLLAILAFKALASEAPKLEVVPNSKTKAIIALDNSESKTFKLSIEDKNGDVLFFQESIIEGNHYSKIFDFKNLSKGIYTITAKNSYGEEKQDIRVNNGNFEVLGKKEVHAPYVELKGNTLKLSYLNHSLSNVEMQIVDQNGNLFSKILGKDFSIQAGFNLSNLTTGELAINIISGNKTYSYYFEK